MKGVPLGEADIPPQHSQSLSISALFFPPLSLSLCRSTPLILVFTVSHRRHSLSLSHCVHSLLFFRALLPLPLWLFDSLCRRVFCPHFDSRGTVPDLSRIMWKIGLIFNHSLNPRFPSLCWCHPLRPLVQSSLFLLSPPVHKSTPLPLVISPPYSQLPFL